MAATPDAAPFSLCAGHPVLDLVNTLDDRFKPEGPVELLTDYRTLLAFMRQSGLLDRYQADALTSRTGKTDAQRSLEAARELRETAAAVLYAIVEGTEPASADVGRLERSVKTARERQELMWAPSTRGFGWGWGSLQTEADLPVWTLAAQTAELLTSDAMNRLRSCQCDTCRWLFLDTSKNHTRRWCDMKVCGNRMKARRFQARRTT